MKIPGLGGKVNGTLKSGEWYLLRAEAARFLDDNRRMEVTFAVEDTAAAGGKFIDDFYLTPKAISRMRTFLSRSGYPADLMEQEELVPEKIVGLQVRAKVKEDRGVIRTDGWNFMAADDTPEAEEKVIDHSVAVEAEDF